MWSWLGRLFVGLIFCLFICLFFFFSRAYVVWIVIPQKDGIMGGGHRAPSAVIPSIYRQDDSKYIYKNESL
jgi:hypothetical protein